VQLTRAPLAPRTATRATDPRATTECLPSRDPLALPTSCVPTAKPLPPPLGAYRLAEPHAHAVGEQHVLARAAQVIGALLRRVEEVHLRRPAHIHLHASEPLTRERVFKVTLLVPTMTRARQRE
jgi:hypothetical protein